MAFTKKRLFIILGEFAAVCGVFALSVFFFYDSIFLNGLKQLSTQPCDGMMRNETVKEILPDAQNVIEDSNTNPLARFLVASCSVRTSEGSVLSSHVSLHDSNLRELRHDFHRQMADDGEVIRFGNSEIEAQSGSETTAVYFHCTPAERSKASDKYLLATESRILGASRNGGKDLRKSLSEIAVQTAERVHTSMLCEEPFQRIDIDTSVFD